MDTTGQQDLAKRDDLGLLYRRQKLTDVYGVHFERVRPDDKPAYPLLWVATWSDLGGGQHASEPPMPMPELIPHVEDMLAGRR